MYCGDSTNVVLQKTTDNNHHIHVYKNICTDETVK